MVDNAAEFAAGLAMQQGKEDPQKSLVKAFRLIWIERRVRQGEQLICNSSRGTQAKEAGTGDGVLKLRAAMLRAEVCVALHGQERGHACLHTVTRKRTPQQR